MTTLNRIIVSYWLKFNILNLVCSVFKLERERERVNLASLARQFNHYLLNSKELASLSFMNLRRLFCGQTLQKGGDRGYYSPSFNKNLITPVLFFGSQEITIAGVPGTNLHRPFSYMSDLKSIVLLVKVELGILFKSKIVCMCLRMFVWDSTGHRQIFNL